MLLARLLPIAGLHDLVGDVRGQDFRDPLLNAAGRKNLSTWRIVLRSWGNMIRLNRVKVNMRSRISCAPLEKGKTS